MAKIRIVVLGAGFGGLELSSILSERLADRLDLTLIDQSDSFIFGFSKLDVMFGRKTPESVRVPYSAISKPGVRFVREVITSIDPTARRVTTANARYEADILVVALGADYNIAGTPGLAEGGNEYYSVAGAERLRQVLPTFSKGHAIVGVTGPSFKCPPAPSEAALLLHDFLVTRKVRQNCTISLVMPFGVPIPPSPDTSQALLAAFAERNITFVPNRTVKALDSKRKAVVLDDRGEMPYDLFLGIPIHCAPDVVAKSGMVEDVWIPVERGTLKTKYPGVYAIGDVNSVGTPKAGVFAEGSAQHVAASIIADLSGGPQPAPYNGAAGCFIEFGGGQVGRVDVDFFSGPKPTGKLTPASIALVHDKEQFGASRCARWFGMKG